MYEGKLEVFLKRTMDGVGMNKEVHENSFRLFWPDLCRVLAIFGVVVIHACGSFFNKYGTIAEGDWLSVNFLDSLVRCSVPLFVMLSGALLLKRDTGLAVIPEIIRRISKVLIPLILWGVSYLFYVSYFSGESIKWRSLLTQPPMYHLWFVYMIIGIYFLLPVFQAIFQAIINRRDLQIYLLAIWAVMTCGPIYQSMPLLNLMQQTSLFGYGGYFILGGVIASSSFDRVIAPVWAAIYLVGVAVTFFLTSQSSKQANQLIETAYLYFSLNVVVSSVAAFVLISKIRIGKRWASILQWVSDKAFLIFFMHVVILERVSNALVALDLGAPLGILILLISVITFAICLMVSACIRMAPGSKFLLG